MASFKNLKQTITICLCLFSINLSAQSLEIQVSEKEVLFFTTDPNVFFGNYNNISAHDGRIASVWTRVDEGQTSAWTTIIEHEDLK